jgi:hypothetical protein
VMGAPGLVFRKYTYLAIDRCLTNWDDGHR